MTEEEGPAGRAEAARTQLVVVLARLVPLAQLIAHGVMALAVAAAVAAVMFTFGLGALVAPDSLLELLVVVIAGGVAAVPAGVIFAFHRALAEVVVLPKKLRSYPEMVREHGPELLDIVRRAETADGGAAPGSRRRLGRDVVTVLRLMRKVADGVPDRGALLPLVSVPFLLAVAVGVVAVPVVWLLAVLLVLAAAASLVI